MARPRASPSRAPQPDYARGVKFERRQVNSFRCRYFVGDFTSIGYFFGQDRGRPEMANGVTPELLDFILRLAQFLLIAFGILIGGAAVVYITMFWKGNLTASGIA